MAVVELIGATTTKTGLKVESALDERTYQKGIQGQQGRDEAASTSPAMQFHPEWNYTIKPRHPKEP